MILIGLDSANSEDYGARSGRLLGWRNVSASGLEQNQFAIWLPFGVTSIDEPVSTAFYDGRTYLVGGYSANIVLDEVYRCWRQGILAPTDPPSITGGSGEAAVAYWSFYDEVTGERSPLSGGTATLASGTRTWSSLPTRPPDDVYISEGTLKAGAYYLASEDPRSRLFFLRPGDVMDTGSEVVSIEAVGMRDDGGGEFPVVIPTRHPWSGGETGLDSTALPATRVSHVECWIEESGDYPRLVGRVPIGGTELVDTSTLATRGEAFINSFERFPYCTINTIYHDRQILAGNPDAEDTVYVSELFLPERWGGLSFRTRNGEKVVSLLGTRDYCLVMTDKSSYILQGYTDNDFTFQMVDPNIGAVTHVGNVVIHGYPYVWTHEGPFMYAGSWHPMSPENRHYFRNALQGGGFFEPMNSADAPTGPTKEFRYWRGTHDPEWNTWVTGGTVVVDYTTMIPQSGGGFAPARISIDSHALDGPDITAGATPSVTKFQVAPINVWSTAFVKESPDDVYGYVYMLMQPPIAGLYDKDNAVVPALSGNTCLYRVATKTGLASFSPNEMFHSRVGGTDWGMSYMPMEFRVIMPHHLGQETPGRRETGAYIREGKSYHRLWVHAIAEGIKTRFWEYSTATAQLGATQAYVCFYPGEEYAYQVNEKTIPSVEITRSLTNPLVPATAWSKWNPWEPLATPLDHTTDADSMYRGVHTVPTNERPLSGRGLTVEFYVKWVSDTVRFLGWGAEFGSGPATKYMDDAAYPFPQA